jgi:very-short-patch-repair endonuclease
LGKASRIMDNSGIIRGPHRDDKWQAARDMRRLMTPMEERLWDRLRAGKVPGLHFRRQQVIDGFIADFYCHQAGIIVEVDGEIHHSRAEYDKERDRAIAARGFDTLRFTNDEVRDRLDEVVGRIEAACRLRQPLLSADASAGATSGEPTPPGATGADAAAPGDPP